MPELRPSEYLAYRDAAQAILARHDGDAAMTAFGLSELFTDPDPARDLTPVYAFLEAQGHRGANTDTLGRLGLVGLPAVVIGTATTPGLLGCAVGNGDLVAVPGLKTDSTVIVDRLGTGLIAAHRDAIHPRAQPPTADPYITIASVDLSTATTVMPDLAVNGQRTSMRARTQLGAAAEMLGIANRILGDAIDYGRQREQFGRPITTFQAMQHLLAWAATERHQLACLLDIAIAQAATGSLDPALSRATKAMAGHTLHAIVQAATQTTGAIAFTAEYSLAALHSRVLALDQIAGTSADLTAAIGRDLRVKAALPELFGLRDTSQQHDQKSSS